jgi:flagellar biosynthesis protein FlhB
MAEDSYQDRTEQPTPKRRSEAREKGRVARSRDLSAAVVLVTGLGVLVLASPPWECKAPPWCGRPWRGCGRAW